MSQPVPSLNWLRVFEAAARYQSFARAAGELNMSAAAVSQQIRALEARLGTPLFDRHAHAVSLTEMGQAYLPAVQHALVSLQEATEGLFGSAQQQSVFIEAVPLFADGVLAQVIASFRVLHPEVEVTLTTDLGGGQATRRYHDLRVIFGTPTGTDGLSEWLLGERLYPVATPALAAEVSDPADLLKHPLIDVAQHRTGWAYVFEKMGFVSRAARYIRTDSTVMAAALAREGAGIALARAPASDAVMRGAGLVPCLDGFMLTGAYGYHLTYADHPALRRPAQLFRAHLHAACRTLEAGP
ncbi:LysR family transcriptional regulator [Roseovarius faecimaris]|uniref:LysR family transcriptional regulator n=1 Tax=Roseovarius faecimaris TaxID=2494550 RepID=A0A6I6IM81_9RHOB|nr:LysR family transcriptional regulator [Roseovarius faecimaris]QGX97685.1 LysR family transcriptional regulator [Roseovarius faecimaris]